MSHHVMKDIGSSFKLMTLDTLLLQILCLAADDDPSNLPLEQLDAVTLQELTKLHQHISRIVEFHKNQE